MVGLHIESGGISVDTVETEAGKTPDRGADSRGTESGKSAGIESPQRIHGRYLCACDGFRSSVRSITGAAFTEKLYADTFLMGDYRDRSSYGSEAHLFFTAMGSVESFPLPGGRRRWIIQTPRYEEEPGPGYLEEQVRARAGFLLHEGDRSWISPFRVHRRIMDSFSQGRILFLGDAAHTISPIGGQGMNTGFADAEFAAALLESLLGAGRGAAWLTEHEDECKDEGEDEEARRARLFTLYSRCRRKAALTAARRATLSMKTGTVHGRLPSGLRNLLLKLLLASPLAGLLPGHYAMLTIPCRNLRAADSSR
jgi:2-polyprenyl-6-methoxyphenol hydroxylase-like FAD-dependent oxidoreductase